SPAPVLSLLSACARLGGGDVALCVREHHLPGICLALRGGGRDAAQAASFLRGLLHHLPPAGAAELFRGPGGAPTQLYGALAACLQGSLAGVPPADVPRLLVGPAPDLSEARAAALPVLAILAAIPAALPDLAHNGLHKAQTDRLVNCVELMLAASCDEEDAEVWECLVNIVDALRD
ncbi:hypothetical protein TeGR_g7878, partial [Tetraparma gracilis]